MIKTNNSQMNDSDYIPSQDQKCRCLMQLGKAPVDEATDEQELPHCDYGTATLLLSHFHLKYSD